MNILIRDITNPKNPKVVAELEVNSNDIIPIVGDKISHAVEKKGYMNSDMIVTRTFDVIRRDFNLSGIGTNLPRISSVDYEVKHDGTEVDN